MKIIAKTKAVLREQKAETMVEVVVAFVVLSIVMVMFSQGLKYATTAEVYAVENGKACDKALINLQRFITGTPDDTGNNVPSSPLDEGVRVTSSDTENKTLNNQSDMVKLTKYAVVYPEGGDTNVYTYWVFDANVG